MKKKIRNIKYIFWQVILNMQQSKYIFSRLYVLFIIFANQRSINKDLQDLKGSFYISKLYALIRQFFLYQSRFDLIMHAIAGVSETRFMDNMKIYIHTTPLM